MMQRRDSGAQFRAHSHDPGIKSPLLWSNVMTDLWWVQSLSLGFTISRISFAQDAVSIILRRVKSQFFRFQLGRRRADGIFDELRLRPIAGNLLAPIYSPEEQLSPIAPIFLIYNSTLVFVTVAASLKLKMKLFLSFECCYFRFRIYFIFHQLHYTNRCKIV